MIATLEQWLKGMGVVVRYHPHVDKGNPYDPNTKVISLVETADEERRLFSLIHEAGHAVLFKDLELHKEAYPAKYHEDPQIQAWLTDMLQEEYDAWTEGYKLVEDLDLDIDVARFEEHADKCLNQYRAFAHTVSNFETKVIGNDHEAFDLVLKYFKKLNNAQG